MASSVMHRFARLVTYCPGFFCRLFDRKTPALSRVFYYWPNLRAGSLCLVELSGEGWENVAAMARGWFCSATG
jgi:hypothetical protein